MKEYFSSRQTVSTWFREENWSPVLRLYVDEQLNYVASLCQWQGKSVLDAGTGFGRFARALALGGAKVWGVDINPDMIELARSTNKDLSPSAVTWQLGDVENLNFQDESFDVVVCMETLMHVGDPRKAVAELARVVSSGGMVVLGINNRFSLMYLLLNIQFHARLYKLLKKKPVIHRTATIGQLHSWLKDANLKMCDEVGIGLAHPEMNLALVPGVSVNLVPHRLSRKLLAIERRYGLGRTPLKHAMKAVLVCALKPKIGL